MNLINIPASMGSRLGLTVSVSPFRFRLVALMERYPSQTAVCFEDWLLDVANRRGARIIVRPDPASIEFIPPPMSELSDEELTVAICLLQGRDRPQLLRLAAQLISRDKLNLDTLRKLATRERIGPVLLAMAREALKVAPEHHSWRFLAQTFASAHLPHDVVLHWTRLAEPVMSNGRVNASSWRLVA